MSWEVFQDFVEDHPLLLLFKFIALLHRVVEIFLHLPDLLLTSVLFNKRLYLNHIIEYPSRLHPRLLWLALFRYFLFLLTGRSFLRRLASFRVSFLFLLHEWLSLFGSKGREFRLDINPLAVFNKLDFLLLYWLFLLLLLLLVLELKVDVNRGIAASILSLVHRKNKVFLSC